MEIHIIGGGPAGLYFAILMKKCDPAHQITVYERNAPNDTFGWGVVFSDKTLSYLRESDYESFLTITNTFETWENVDIVHRNQKISVGGNKFSGIARIALLNILQDRCQQLGVDLRFRTEISDVEALQRKGDLLIGADGVSSTVRQTFSAEFRPSLSTRANKYIWYGTQKLFHGLTLTFRESAAGVFAAHSYKFNKTTSTFIVECDEETWTNAHFDEMSDEDMRRYLENIFATDLQGNALLSNKSKWINFVHVKNKNWSYGNVVLLGDALHTAHFSIGSGTKLALEDAIVLVDCLNRTGTVPEALLEFQRVRKPVIEAYQLAALESCIWFENMKNYLHLEPLPFAFELMTRSGRLDYESLRRRDPAFVAAYEKIATSEELQREI